MSFDEEQLDPHGECAHEISRLKEQIKRLKSGVTTLREDPVIIVGGYEISYFPEQTYWIQGPDGDGMQTSSKFEKLIAEFFKENM